MALQQECDLCHTLNFIASRFFPAPTNICRKILKLQEMNACSAHLIYTNLFAVFRVGEVNEVVIVHLLGVDDVTVLLLAQVLGVDAIGSQKLLISYAERLADGLSD